MSFIDAARWAKHLEQNPQLSGSLEFARHDKQGRVGTWTSNDKKIAFAQELQKAVPTMTFAREFITLAADKRVPINALIEQVRTFRREIVVPVGDGVAQLHNKITITGKSPGKRDDLVMALCIAIYHGLLERTNWAFRVRMKQRGLIP